MLELPEIIDKALTAESNWIRPKLIPGKPLYLYGNGKLGKLAQEFFKTVGVKYELVFEGNERPDTNAQVAVCIVNSPYVPIALKLQQRGFTDIAPFYDFAGNFTDIHPLNNGWFAGPLTEEEQQKTRNVLQRWEDDVSRAHHLQFIAWRRLREEWSFDWAPLVPVADRYFIPEVCDVLSDHEVFMDCGAYLGEASLKMKELVPSASIIAIEPMPSNLSWLQDAKIFRAALGRRTEPGTMFGDGMTAKLDPRGKTSLVRVFAVDDLSETPTFIKVHVEGGELDVLRGAAKTLTKNRPIVVAGIYHNSDGIYHTAEYLMGLLENYRFLFRSIVGVVAVPLFMQYQRRETMSVNLREAFLGVDPFIGYEPEFPLYIDWSNGIPNINREIFDFVFSGFPNPSLIIEVGTWKGDSAIKMADYVAEGGTILCIDTWLGNYDMWKFSDMHRKNGYPQAYYQFLSNVIHCKKQHIIAPMPITSHIASHILKDWNVKADAIYIDASHEYQDVKRDLEDYWSLVKDGGVLFGDDYSAWEGVRRAADEFAKQISVKLTTFNTSGDGRVYWIMEKR